MKGMKTTPSTGIPSDNTLNLDLCNCNREMQVFYICLRTFKECKDSS